MSDTRGLSLLKKIPSNLSEYIQANDLVEVVRTLSDENVLSLLYAEHRLDWWNLDPFLLKLEKLPLDQALDLIGQLGVIHDWAYDTGKNMDDIRCPAPSRLLCKVIASEHLQNFLVIFENEDGSLVEEGSRLEELCNFLKEIYLRGGLLVS